MKSINNLSKITVILVLYQESEDLIFKNLEKIKNFNIIILDNNSNLNLKKKITSKFKIEKYILSKKNLGFSMGYNMAIKFCSTEFLFILNADCFINESNTLKLLNYIQTNPNCMLVAPTSFDSMGNFTYCSGNLPEKNNKNEYLKIDGNSCVESVLGSAMFMRTKDFLELGMFDKNLFIYFSDDDLCRTILKKKKSIVQLSESTCIHTHGISKVNSSLRKIFLREHYYTLDELFYFQKVNKHQILYLNLKKKIKNYVIKMLINFFILNFKNSIKYYSRILAFIKFNFFLRKSNK